MFVIVITSNQLPGSLASFAVDSPQTLTIYGLRKVGRWGARLAMSSLFLCVGDTIARSTVAGTKANGGGQLGLIRWLPLALYGWNVIHCRSRATKSLRAMARRAKCPAGEHSRPSQIDGAKLAQRSPPSSCSRPVFSPHRTTVPQRGNSSLLREFDVEIARREGEPPPRRGFFVVGPARTGKTTSGEGRRQSKRQRGGEVSGRFEVGLRGGAATARADGDFLLQARCTARTRELGEL